MKNKSENIFLSTGTPQISIPASNFKNKYRDKVIGYSSQGMSREEILTNLVYGQSGFMGEIYDEIRANEELFNELISDYSDFSYGWWMAQGRKFVIEMTGVGVDRINFQVWYAVMKNRFGWTDLKKLSMDGELRIRLTDEERDERIERLQRMVQEN